MAEVTRFKDLQEAQKKLDQLLQSESMKRTATDLKVQEQIAGFDQKFEHITTTLAELQLQLLNMGNHTGSGHESILGGYISTPGGKSGPTSNFVHTPLPRIEFPRFDGVNPRAWIVKCNSYFKLMPSIPDTQRVHLASMHFEGKALAWFQNLNMGDLIITWKQFLEVVSARFEDLRTSNIIVEFNKLKQTGSYEDYVERFEELRSCLVMEDASKFTEEYFIASFLSGLSAELQSFINMFHPQTLEQTIDLGRQQLITLEAITKSLLPSSQPYHNPPNIYKKTETLPNLPSVPALDSNTKSNPSPIKLLTSVEMAARRDKGLCYNCDEKYVFGHRCAKRVNYVMMTETEELIASKEFADLELQEVETNMVQHIDEVHISLHSIMGEDRITTMRVVGEVGLHKLDILLDTGSTLSFINETTATDLGCTVHIDKPLLVRVANGQKLISTRRATDFKWFVQGHEFQFSPRLLTNEGCDMILGGDWLRVCSPIELDYATMTFTVSLEGERVKFQASTTGVNSSSNHGSILTSLTHEEITDFDEFSIIETGAVQVKLKFMLESAEKRFGIGDEVSRRVQPLHRDSIYWSNKKEIVPLVEYVADDAARLVGRISSGRLSAAVEGVEGIRCKRHIPIQFLSFDPWGQGSTAGGGIVMDLDGLKKRGELWKMNEDERLQIEVVIDAEKGKGGEKVGLKKKIGPIGVCSIGPDEV